MNGYRLNESVLKPVLRPFSSILGSLNLKNSNLYIEPEKKQSEPVIHILENELKKNKNLHNNSLW